MEPAATQASLGVRALGVWSSLRPHLSSNDPTVNPAPTDTINSRSPRFSRFSSTASLNASGIVAAVVLPKRSMLMTTFSSGTPSFAAADRMIRRFAWMRHEQVDLLGAEIVPLQDASAGSSVLRTANLNTAWPSCLT